MKIYFNGLDGIRAFAAVSVMIAHVIEISGSPLYHAIDYLGFNGVIVFYVLSGYLITSLLLLEKENHGKINFKNFYVRRILRIWPLYFFIIAISLFFFDFHPPTWVLFFYLLILPNFPHAAGYSWNPSVQIWTIGVEEQFYMFWPFLANRSKQFVWKFLVLFIPIWTILPHLIAYVSLKTGLLSHDTLAYVTKFFWGAKFNCMAIGALLAYVNLNHKQWLYTFFKSKLTFVAACVIWFIAFYFELYQSYFNHEILALATAVVIGYITNHRTILFDNQLIKFLGKISYGIYMYHWLVAGFVITYYRSHFNPQLQDIDVLYVVILSSILSIALAYFSFHYLEAYFLRLKEKFNA
jgi:peptidoglycan/LPS O-acetylase OafA/YrhL